jgi:RNA polymerase sigma-70 factor (ECF subfamily)
MPAVESSEIARIFRECSGRAVATLARRFGDLGLAEEMVQEAFVVALDHWRNAGLPPNPAGWLITTAHRAALDRVRREASRNERQLESQRLYGPDESETPEEGPVLDDQLRLMFTCCHPALAPDAQVALTLRLIAGLETREIARAFLVPETTMAQRLVRAKNKIRDARIPYRVPDVDELPSRMRWVLAVVYFIYNEGYVASGGPALDRADLGAEALRLARHAVELVPNDMEARGLLALLLLLESRRTARSAPDGSLVPLAEQDRTSWDRALISEGHALVRQCLVVNRPGPYQLQAAINAVHADAATAAATDWRQIVLLYDLLAAQMPTPVVALNRAVAIAEVRGPADALALVDALALDGYHLFHAVRADLLSRLGRCGEADAAYAAAAARTTNLGELRFLERRRRDVAALRERASN